MVEVWDKCDTYQKVADETGINLYQVSATRTKLRELGISLPKKASQILSVYRLAAEEIKKLFPQYVINQ